MKHNIRWVILALIIVASFISYLLRTNVSVVAGAMSADLGLSERQLGLIFSAFGAGYALFQFPGGILGSSYGPRLVLGMAALAWGVLTVITALVPDQDSASAAVIVAWLVVSRFLVGAAHAPLFPCTAGATIANWFPKGSWGLPNGLTSTGLTLGAAATAPLIVWLMESTSWRGAILWTAPSAFVLAALWWWYVRDFPRDHRHVTARELELIDKDRDEPGDVRGGWKRVLQNRDVLLLAISYFCMNYVFYLFFSWFFYYLTEIKDIGAAEASVLTAYLWVLGAVGATVGGFACDYAIKRLGLRWGPALIGVTGLGAASVLLIAGALAENPYLAVALFCLCFASTQITEAGFWSTTISVSRRYAGAATGVLNTGGNLPGLVGGVLVANLAAQFGWTLAIASGSIFALVGAILWLFIRGDRPMQLEAMPVPPRDIQEEIG